MLLLCSTITTTISPRKCKTWQKKSVWYSIAGSTAGSGFTPLTLCFWLPCDFSEVLERVQQKEEPAFRPSVKNTVLGTVDLHDMISMCWLDNPDSRPGMCSIQGQTFSEIVETRIALNDKSLPLALFIPNQIALSKDQRTCYLIFEVFILYSSDILRHRVLRL